MKQQSKLFFSTLLTLKTPSMENSFCKVSGGVLLFTRATSIVPRMPTTKLERVMNRDQLHKLMDEARVFFSLAYFLLTVCPYFS